MTASTPPLVDVIAEAILRELGSPLWAAENEGMLDDPISAANSAARAVLDALEKAGGVEWGITWDGAMFDPLQANTLAAAKNVAASMAKITSDGAEPYVISRITGPWTAVEG